MSCDLGPARARGDLARRAHRAALSPRLSRSLPRVRQADLNLDPRHRSRLNYELDPRLADLADLRPRPTPPPEHPTSRKDHDPRGSPKTTCVPRSPGRSALAPRADRPDLERVPPLPWPMKRAHFACVECGWYGGRETVRIKVPSRPKPEQRTRAVRAGASSLGPDHGAPWIWHRSRRRDPEASGRVRVAVDAMGGDHAPRRSSAARRLGGDPPGDGEMSSSSATRPAASGCSSTAPCRRTSRSSRPMSGSPWTSNRPRRSDASATPASTSACGSSARARGCGRDRRPHGRRGGLGPRVPGPPRGRRSAGAGGPGGLRSRPVRLARHRRDDRLDGHQPVAVRADGAIYRGSGTRGRIRPWRCCRSARRGGRVRRASRRRPSASRDRPAVRGQRRGAGPAPPSGRRRRLRRDGRQRDHQVLRGALAAHLRPAHDRIQAAALGPIGYVFMRRGIDRIRASSTTSSSVARRCSASRAPCS